MTRPGTLAHVTLLTGDVRISPREEVSRETIEALRPPLRTGAFKVPGFPQYTVVCQEVEVKPLAPVLAFHVQDDRALLVRCLVVRDKAAAEHWWTALVEQETETGRVAPGLARPPAPWLAVMIEPGLARDFGAATWLGDFERCLAWVWLTEERERREALDWWRSATGQEE